MARAFAALGDRVWVTDVDAGAVAAMPSGIRATVCDAASEPDMVALFAAVQADWGGVDVLCANAGIKGPTAAVTEMPLDEWHRCIAVNLDGAMLAAKHGVPLMVPGGAIVFTSSTAGTHGMPFRAPYVAAKWGVIGLMKSVAMELGPKGIRANAICPGSVNGPRIDAVIAAEAEAKGMTPDAVRGAYTAGAALKRLVDAKDVAAMALFLASEGARNVTGQAMLVDAMTYNVDP